MKINIAGDLVITRKYPIENISKSIIDVFSESDFNIINLEAPLTTTDVKIKKTGPHLKSDIDSTINVLKLLKTDLVSLANNHILDYSDKGLLDTLDKCFENKIDTVGANINLKEASKIYYIDKNDLKIGVVNFTENEWTCASKDKAGANPMDLIENYNSIKEAKNNSDRVIVIVHGGNEYNHYPSPRMVKQYRHYVDIGADAVIAHHTHCIGGYEEWNDAPIFYSLGNFLFTKDIVKQDSWYKGLIVQLDISKNKKIEFKYYICSQLPLNHKLVVLNGDDYDYYNNELSEINKVFSNNELLEEKWENFTKQKVEMFYKTITPIALFKNKYLRYLILKSGLANMFLSETYLKEHLNRIRCESHLDISKYMLSSKLYKSK